MEEQSFKNNFKNKSQKNDFFSLKLKNMKA